MSSFLSRLRERPVKEKKIIAIGTSAGVTLLIFVMWFVSLQFGVDEERERTPGFFEGLRVHTDQFFSEAGEVVSETERSYKEGDIAKLVEFMRFMEELEKIDMTATSSDPETAEIKKEILELVDLMEERYDKKDLTSEEEEELYVEMLEMEERLFDLLVRLMEKKTGKYPEFMDNKLDEEELPDEDFEEEEF